MVVAIILLLVGLLAFAPTISNVIASKTKESPQEEQERKSKEQADQMTREDEGIFGTFGRLVLGDALFEDTFSNSSNTSRELEESTSNILSKDVKFGGATQSDKERIVQFDKPLSALSVNDSILISQSLQKQSGRKSTNFGVVE